MVIKDRLATCGNLGPRFKRLLIWAGLAFGLNALWEIAQLPLYTLWDEQNVWRIVAYVSHCTLGDVLITTGLFLFIAALFRRMEWPIVAPWLGGAFLVAGGTGYTLLSEWYNIYRVSAWAYKPQMPLVMGIGLTPILQWLIVPTMTVILIRRFDPPRKHGRRGQCLN